MNLKPFVCVAALAFLASCGQGASTYNPATPSALNNPDLAPGAKYNGPTFGIAIELPDALHPNSGQASFASLKATTFVGKKKYVYLLKGGPHGCQASESGGKTYGCAVLSSSSKEWKIKSSTFLIYSKPDAKGCILAEDHFKGEVVENSTLFDNLKAVNTKTCW